ncbi:MAG: T9SS type A sorting domain-containing protein [Bacteroidales bacterium]|nr:T9SS type A sorting domain-containing protein [Bacteroidales bacterium]
MVSVIGSYIDAYGVSNSLYSRDEAHKSSLCTEDPPTGGESDPVNSLDPNDIHGYLSESGSHYMRREIQSVQYEIEFENDTTLATAAAHTIIVRDTLDATKFDLNSLAARSVTIGDKRLELNGEQTFACTLDLRPEIYVIAQIEQEYDASTGIVQWTIESLDPMTMEPTDNPNQGALPINYNGEGIATFTFNIDLKEPFPDGTEISNRVGIIFDLEEPVITDTWTNIVDAVKPTSQIEEVTPVADSLSFSFVSEDNRSGVWYHTLYYRNDSTYQEWQVKKAQIFEDNFMLKLDDLLTTEFLVMAVDSAGNREDKLMNAEYVFSLDSVVYYTLAVESQGCGEVSGVGTYLAGSHVVIEAVPDVGCQFVQWNDGLTDNPRTVELVQDTTFVAQFSSDHSDITQTTDLTSGWNWWSSYVELDGASSLQSLENGLGINGEMIKSQDNGYASYLEGYGWYGSLSSISNESTYQVKSNEACSVEMTGSTANPEEHPITLNSGWTWVGYPVNASMSVEDALANITPQNGDMLKSQNDGYASYLDGFGWYGSLNTLNPGMGLMYKSNNGNSVTLLYPTSGTRTDLKTNQTTENNHWQPNLNAYADNMSVMAVVELDGEELASERYELAAFANGEVRGSARLMYVDPIDRYMAFLTIAGDEASELRFGLYDAETGDVETQSFASLQYETNAVVGSFVEPYVVSLRGTTGLDEWFGGLNVFPNPVERGEIVTLVLPEAGTLRATSVEIIDALGTEVETLHAPSVQAITAPKVAGVYTLRITVEGKGTCFRKLVVR